MLLLVPEEIAEKPGNAVSEIKEFVTNHLQVLAKSYQIAVERRKHFSIYYEVCSGQIEHLERLWGLGSPLGKSSVGKNRVTGQLLASEIGCKIGDLSGNIQGVFSNAEKKILTHNNKP